MVKSKKKENKIIKTLWGFRNFFLEGIFPKMIFMFLFVLIMGEHLIPAAEHIWLRYYLIIFTISFATAITLDCLFDAEIFKKPTKTKDEKTKRR